MQEEEKGKKSGEMGGVKSIPGEREAETGGNKGGKFRFTGEDSLRSHFSLFYRECGTGETKNCLGKHERNLLKHPETRPGEKRGNRPVTTGNFQNGTSRGWGKANMGFT